MKARGNQSPESLVKEISRNTRRKYTSEEKIRIVLERLKGEVSKAELYQSAKLFELLPFFVTDNGLSFVARRFNHHLKDRFRPLGIRYRPPTQLGLPERFHKTLKDEEVYWRLYDHRGHCRESLAEFRDRYNDWRPHWALIPAEGGDPLTPHEVYVEGCRTQLPRWQSWAKAAREKLDRMLTEVA